MVVTSFGILIDSSDSQPVKALFPIDVTLSGILIDLRKLQALNVLSIDNQQFAR